MRITTRLVAAGGTVAAAALLVASAGAGHALTLGTYAVSATASANGVSVTSVPNGSGATYSFTVSNTTSSNDYLQKAEISVPTGYSAVAATAPTITDSQGQPWSVTVSGNEVDLAAATPAPIAAGLAPGASVTATFTANAPLSTGTYTFSTAAQGALGGVVGQPNDFANPGGDPAFSSYQPANTTTASYTTCAPNQTCTTPVTGPATNDQISVVDNNGNTNDVITTQAPSPVHPPCDTVNNPAQPVAYQTTDRSSTLTVNLFIPSPVVKQAIQQYQPGDKYGLCWEQDRAFTGVDSSGNATPSLPVTRNGEAHFYGYLPLCSKNANVAPCVTSVSTYDDHIATSYNGHDVPSFKVVINGTPGDPVPVPVNLGSL